MVDWLRITARGQKPQMTQYHYPSSYIAKEGTHLDAAAAVKKAVSLPVVSGGRILTPAFADQAIAAGRCDQIGSAHVGTPVTHEHPVCRPLPDKKNITKKSHT